MNSILEPEPAKVERSLSGAEVLDALREIYLYAGLSPQHALSSALADYECNFAPQSDTP